MTRFLFLFLGPVLACVACASPAASQTAREAKLNEWMATHPHARTITLTGRNHGNYYRAYNCSTYDAAVKIVASIETAKARTKSPRALQVTMRRGLKAAGCSPAAADSYTPHAIGDFAIIDLGVEAEEEWTPIRAFHSNGRIANLVYDASVYAIAD